MDTQARDESKIRFVVIEGVSCEPFSNVLRQSRMRKCSPQRRLGQGTCAEL